jgi:quinol monooxygenase YgiN
MSHKGKVQLTVIFTATPELVGEGERIFASHGAWMAESHHREGELALLSYEVSKGPEPTNALDPTSAPTGNTLFVMSEIYESDAGIQDHWKQGAENWPDFQAFMAWAQKCNAKMVHRAEVINSLW